MTKIKKLITYLLIISMILPMVPIGEMLVLAADEVNVTDIAVFRTYQDFTGTGEYGIIIRGSGLSKATIRYMLSGGSEYIPATNPGPGSDDSFRQYSIPSSQVISRIMVGTKDFVVSETNMPKLSSISPTQVDLNEGSPMVEVKGQNFLYFGEFGDSTTSIRIENTDVTNEFIGMGNIVTLYEEDLRKYGYGNKNIIIERSRKEGNVNISMVYNQINALRIFESISIDPSQDVTIYPNRGKIGSPTTITINNKKENYSVFFLENETDLFKYENMGEKPEYQQTTEDKSIIKVNIPKGLTVGKTYKVVITNNLDKEKKIGLDMTNLVTKQKVIGEFYVVDAKVGPMIDKPIPNQGTSAGSYLTIYGYRLEELKISDLVVEDNTVETSNLSVLKGGTDDPTKLRIKYDESGMTYKGKVVKEATRDFLVTIGRDALFEDDHIGKNVFRLGDDKEDEIYVRTKTIDTADLKDPKKDIVVEITTTIEDVDGGKFEFTELAILEKGYTFLPSYQDPTITKITPNKIQIDSETNPVTKNTTIHSIEGTDFNVFRYYDDAGEMKTNYPKLIIGGTSDSNAQIIIEKDSDGKIKYTTKENGLPIVTIGGEDSFLEVLDTNGKIVTGVGGNEVGRFITFTLPKNLQVLTNILNRPMAIAVANPKRDSKDRGIYTGKNDAVEFIIATSIPTIEEVKPNTVTVDGGEDIIVTGRGFLEGIEVFIDGKKVPSVTRDIDTQTTRGVLKFKAPKGREGINILQVMNLDGGSDTYEFVFVETIRMDPKITTVAPPRGTEDDIIIIKGDNFLKPDPTITDLRGIGMSKLLGTKVFLGTEEINKYVEGGGLEKYTSPQILYEPLVKIEEDPWTNIKQANLSSYYKQAIIKDSNNKTYKITRDKDGQIVLIGKDKTYSFQYSNAKIEGKDETTKYEVIQENGELILTSAGNEIIFTVEYNSKLFSIIENQFDKKELKVADYYDSLFLDENGKYYKIILNELGETIITDEKENRYDVKLDGNKIVAVKGSVSYEITVEDDKITFDGKELVFKTPYYINPTTKIITGHRVRVLTKNEIEITIPEKQIAGFYDVKVVNPDTKSAKIVKGFEYTKPQIRPVIHYIDPSEGSVDGGYYIIISGENFGDSPEVRINGVLVPAKDTQVNKEDYKSIKVLVPKYAGNIDVDFVTDKKYVRVHVTSGGASSSRDDLFAYKIASSNPKITKILPVKGPTAGGNIVVIEGTDFRFFEPFKGDPPKPGDTNYEDTDGDGKWTNFNSDQDPRIDKIEINDPTIKDYLYYLDSPVLPNIYFGNSKGRIVEFERAIGSDTYRIMVLAPQHNTAGAVDVYLRNNDSGQSPNVKYNYEASNPTINSINTNSGKRVGGEIKSLVAKDYRGTAVRLIERNGIEQQTTIYLVRFGDITNNDIVDTEDPNYGQIKGGKAKVELKEKGPDGKRSIDTGFTAEINGTQLSLSLIDGKKEYRGTYELENGIKYIDLKGLREKTDNTVYPGFELIKVEKNGGRLLIDKGFSPKVKERVIGTLDVTTPTYYRGATVDVVIVNPDGISNKKPFTYVTPGSSPRIDNILNNGKEPAFGDNRTSRVVQVKSKGGNEIQVIGEDFRPNAIITIGEDFLTIKPRFVSEKELAFTMPATTDISKLKIWHNLTVMNDDKGEARSDQSKPTPIRIEITESESNPEISSIEPNKGSVSGGTKVTIKGTDFREIMEGYEDENITVIFGEKETTAVEYNNYDSITAIVPDSKVSGPVTVRVKNPDGTLSTGNIQFNYISKPTIVKVDPNKLFTNDSQTEITITGTMFQQVTKVIVGGKLQDAKVTDTEKYIYGVRDGKNLEKIVVGGVEASSIVVESDKVIKVTFPETKDLDNSSIIIINSDGGISDPYDGFKYEKPIPTRPLVLEGIPGYESTVQLIWSKSDENILNKANSFEIFGRKTSDKENTFIGTTKSAEFLVKGLEPETSYTFMVRALNEYGASIDFAIVTVKTLDKRQDEKLKEKEEKLKAEANKLKENGKEEMQNGRLNITLGTKIFRNGAGAVDLSLAKYKNQNKITIFIPIELARKDNRLTIKDGTMTTVINARDMYTLAVSRQDKGNDDAYLRIHIDKSTGDHLPRGKKPASQAYDLSFDYIYGKDSMEINQLLRTGKLFLEQDKLTYPNTKNTSIYIINEETGEYEKWNNTTAEIKGRSKLILLSDR